MNSELAGRALPGDKIDRFVSVLREQGAIEPVVLPLPGENALAEAMIVAAATSARHARGLADAIARLCHERNYELLGMEGYGGDWILLDGNDIIVQLLLEESRKLYRLEDLWAEAGAHKES